MFAFFFAAVLIKLPPFYLFPFLPSTLFTTHTLAKIVFLSLSIISFNRLKSVAAGSTSFFVYFLLAVFFLTQSVSVFGAQNLGFFWKQYQNIIASILIFICTVLVIRKEPLSRLDKFMYWLGIVILSIEALFLFFTDIFSQLLQVSIQKDLWNLYVFNLQQGRHNLFLSGELFLPFFVSELISSFRQKNKIRIVMNLILIFILIIVSIMTNFRTRLLQVIVAIIGSWLIISSEIKMKQRRKILIIGLGLCFLTLVSVFYFRFDNQRTTNERFDTAYYRYQGLIKSVELFKKSPWVGVGLGNYKYYLYNSIDTDDFLSKSTYENSLNSPHSIVSETISETGVIGLLGWLLVIFYFIKQDIWIIKSRVVNIFPYQVASWTIFAYGLVNPFYSIFHIGWFWLLRGIIEAYANH